MAGVALKIVPDKQSFKRVNRLLKSVSPEQNRRIWRNGLVRMALLVSNNAKTKQIAKGGGPVKPKKLTSRTFTLSGSIFVYDRNIPKSIAVGTPLVYGAVHELGSRDGTTPARPYLAPALDANVPRFAKIMVKVIDEEMAKAVAI